MRGNLVSVVVPAYNAEKFIGDAIKSVFDQTYRPIEIIVVNDGSTDSTLYVAEELSKLTPADVDVRVVDIGENKGAANALNVGFSSANGNYICWLSADDMFIDRKKIEKQIHQMSRTKALWGYFRDFYMGTSPSEATLIRTSWMPHLRVLDPVFARNASLRLMTLFFRNPVNGSSTMIRRDCVERYGNFDPILRNVDADSDLWMRYSALRIKVASIKGAPIFYREHPAQLSAKKSDMSYGSELTRMRILLTLERSGRLLELIKKSTPLLFILFKVKSHVRRPIVSKFLCNYILSRKGNFSRILLRPAEKVLIASEENVKSLNIDEDKLLEDVEEAIESPTFKDFQEIMGLV